MGSPVASCQLRGASFLLEVRGGAMLVVVLNALNGDKALKGLDPVYAGLPLPGGALSFSAPEFAVSDLMRNICDKVAREPVAEPDEWTFLFRHPACSVRGDSHCLKGGSVWHGAKSIVNSFVAGAGQV